MEPVCIALARVIRERREARGLLLRELAERTQISRQMLAFVECGDMSPL